MLPKNEAVAAAAAYLKTFAYPDRADSVVMLPDTAIEFIYGWTVRFDFKEHLETGAPAAAPFSSVIVVPHDGTAAHFAPTFPPTEEYMEMRASGKQSLPSVVIHCRGFDRVTVRSRRTMARATTSLGPWASTSG
ncbi:YrhB domain-containing protein [Streptomyces sp. NPDC001410]|uniref:YrhB domain-containing protein n=1 Tax=Streptomyces sp. NPDC001410 TaxID=3364574 RepID=UPI00369394B9